MHPARKSHTADCIQGYTKVKADGFLLREVFNDFIKVVYIMQNSQAYLYLPGIKSTHKELT
jgi:hypothetical protein